MKHKTRGRVDLIALAGLFVAIISAIATIITVPELRQWIWRQTPEPTPTPSSLSSFSGVRIVSQEEQAEMIKAAERDATESRKAAARDAQLRTAELRKASEERAKLSNWKSIKKVRSDELTSFSMYLYPNDWSPPIEFPPGLSCKVKIVRPSGNRIHAMFDNESTILTYHDRQIIQRGAHNSIRLKSGELDELWVVVYFRPTSWPGEY